MIIRKWYTKSSWTLITTKECVLSNVNLRDLSTICFLWTQISTTRFLSRTIIPSSYSRTCSSTGIPILSWSICFSPPVVVPLWTWTLITVPFTRFTSILWVYCFAGVKLFMSRTVPDTIPNTFSVLLLLSSFSFTDILPVIPLLSFKWSFKSLMQQDCGILTPLKVCSLIPPWKLVKSMSTLIISPEAIDAGLLVSTTNTTKVVVLSMLTNNHWKLLLHKCFCYIYCFYAAWNAILSNQWAMNIYCTVCR